jgi:hypothetical protein
VNLAVIRFVVAGAIALVLVMLLVVIGLAIYRGADITSSQLIGLFSFVGTLVALLATLLGVNHVTGAVENIGGTLTVVKELVNGHLKAHIGHSDEEITELIDARLTEYGVAPRAVIETPSPTDREPEST